MPDYRGTLSVNKNSLLEPVIHPLSSAPSAPTEGQLYYNNDNHTMYYWNGSGWIPMDGSGGGSGYDYILLQDQKSSGTNGGQVTTTNWFQRDLNTIAHDDTGVVVVTSNNFTLPAGSYEIFVSCPVRIDYRTRFRLHNVTDSVDVLYGASTSVANTALVTMQGKFTIASSTTFRIDQRFTGTDGDSYSLGYSTGFGVPEIYTQVELRKTA